MILKTVFGRVTMMIFGNAIIAAGSLLNLRITLENLTKEEYGFLGYVLSVCGMAFCVVDLGFSAAHIKNLASQTQPANCLRTYVVIQLRLLGFGMLGLLIWYVCMALLGFLENDARHVFSYLLLIISWGISILTSAIGRTFTGLLQPAKQLIPEATRALALTVFLLCVSFNSNPLVSVSISYAAAATCSLICALCLVAPLRNGKYIDELYAEYAEYASKLRPGIIASSIGRNIDGIIIGQSLSLVELSTYHACKRIVLPIEQISSALDHVIFPILARLVQLKNEKGLRELLGKIESVLVIMMTYVCCHLVIYREVWTKLLIGLKYIQGSPVFAIMACGASLNLYAILWYSAANALGRPEITSQSMLIANSGLALLSCFLILPSIGGFTGLGYGSFGGALSYFIVAALSCVVTRHRVRQLLKYQRLELPLREVGISFFCVIIPKLIVDVAGLSISSYWVLTGSFLLGGCTVGFVVKRGVNEIRER